MTQQFHSWYISKCRRKWQPTPVFLPGESHGQVTWQATVHGTATVTIATTRLSDEEKKNENIYPHKNLQTNVYRNIINSQDIENNPNVHLLPNR